MSESVLELAERAWRGDHGSGEMQPFFAFGDLVEVGKRTAFVPSFANVSAFETDAGLVLVDTGSPMFARQVHASLRGWCDAPLAVAIFTHGHIDHVFGVGPFEDEARSNGWPPPKVIAHEGVVARFDRYVRTAGYNTAINRRQFGAADLEWPTEYRYPDQTYRERLDLDLGGELFELHHGRGETDDHTWVWVPGRGILCCGDFFVWVSPNAGNPQKVQRYPYEWAAALREMAGLGAEVMLPGHGYPVVGAGRVGAVLQDSAELLESLSDQTVALMNEGLPLDEVVRRVEVPEHLTSKPYLQATYDEPEFVVRNLWRLYGGWYDGNPAHLKPAPETELAAEIARLAGGADALASRALELIEAGEGRLAGHLAEMARRAAPGDPGIDAIHERVFEARASSERSTMAQGIFRDAASR